MKKNTLIVVLLLLFNLNLTPNNSLQHMNIRSELILNNTKEQIAFERELNLILKTIRTIESANIYNLSGKSKEYGAYQFTPSTWNSCSIEFFGTVLDIKDPKNQDLVATAKVKKLLEKGFGVDEIASYWNSGKRTYCNNVGINKYGVKYNVPQYVSKFLIIYTKLKAEENNSKKSILFCNLNPDIPYIWV